MVMNRIEKWAARDSSIGKVLLLILAATLIISNSPLYVVYDAILDMPIGFSLGSFVLAKPALLWINEGLMTIFLMQLSLEMKREIVTGLLRDRHQYLLPVVAAIGGIVFPIAIYLIINYHTDTLSGWPIATTTDIAFVLGIVGLLGRRVPISLKLFLITLSIVDDILAVIIIAIAYSQRLSLAALSFAGIALLGLILLKRLGVTRNGPYLVIGALMWVAVMESGIHATLAGIITALFIPLHSTKCSKYSPLRDLEDSLQPWIVCLILPLFVFANGGVVWHATSLTSLTATVPLGIILGLCVGKPLGVFISSSVLIKFGAATLPTQCNWRHFFGGCTLTGIGFTMSLFFTALAFYDSIYENLARQGVLIGSLIACLLGVSCLLKR